MTAKDVAEWDSLNHIRLMVAIEKAFRVHFTTAEVSGLPDVGHLVDAIAAKLRAYEERLRAAMGSGFDYDATPFAERAKLLQQHSSFYAFGTEESYGYLPNDYLRVDEPTNQGIVVPMRQWFDVDEGDALDWAA